ncbi:ABC transporter substrate-binding protein [uncultured Clostridium sp.]|uniref:ABC transporter substrate-binding protein n=1 Tax=uncultured Clostridium sp. TaxID=59620 RepID=UPI0025FAE8C0|nr:ABC transporter substrate-binding protein [uncultured Clostridium sp.]
MKSRKNRAVSAAFMMSFLLLAGCKGPSSEVNYEENGGEPVVLTFFGNKYETENVTVIEEILSGFMKENPDIRVSYESLKGVEYYEALSKRMEAGKGDDVFMVNHDSVLELKKKGRLADLSGIGTIPNYADSMLGQMEDGESIYWLPTSVSVFGLYCNMDLLKEYGQDVPRNLGEWEDTCGLFLEKGITPVIANNDISLKTLAIGQGFFGVYQENRQAEVFERLNSGRESLSQYLTPGFSLAERFIEKGYIDREKALNTMKTSDDLAEFAKGESPFMLTGAWAAGRLTGMAPKLNFQVFPYPVLPDGTLAVINADTRLSINADSAHPEAAVKFVEYFTRPENIQKFADQQCSLSPLKDSAPSSVDAIRPLVSCYQSGRTVIGTDGLLELPIWNLTAEVSMKLLSGETVESAMEWMDQQAEQERGTLQ